MIEILQQSDVLALAEVIRSCGKRVRYLEPLTGNVLTGTARSIGDTRGNFLTGKDDIRKGYLRVTLESGFDTYLPMEVVAHWVNQGLYAVD